MTRDLHLSEELFRGLATGELSLVEVVLQLRDHLLESCPTCQEQWQRYQQAQNARAESYTLEADFNRFVESTLPELLEAHEEAAGFMADLRSLSSEDRRTTVGTGIKAGGPLVRALIEAMLAESRATALDDPQASYDWAALAEHAVALHAQEAEEFSGLWVQAVARQGNGLRLLSRDHEAMQQFERARELMGQVGITGGEVAAEVDSLQGSLYFDLGQYQDAETVLNRAVVQYRFLGEQHLRAKVLIQLGNVYAWRGNHRRALKVTHDALGLLKPQEHRRLYLCARFNIARYLVDQGDFVAARDIVEYEGDSMGLEAGSSIRLNLEWLQGRIAEGFGESEDAIRHFLEAREGFLARCDGYDVALVSLDLAGLYRHQNRREDALQTASEALQLAQAHGLHKEALAALSFLVQSFQEEHHAAQALATVTDFLNQVRRNPEARFQVGGG